jgi:hypothetical protein
MGKTYWTGPLRRLVGTGIYLGIPVGVSWAALIFHLCDGLRSGILVDRFRC